MTVILESPVKETPDISSEKLDIGFKRSEVGIIPEGWKTKKLSEISTVVRGGSPRPAGDSRYFNGNYIPWLTVAALTNIPDSIIYVTKTFGYLTKEGSRHSRILEKGTLIIANSGATLGVAKILGIKCCANDGIAALMNQNYGCSRFITYYLNTKTKYFREVVATGNGQPNLNTTLIGNLEVPFPHVQEQQSIANALSDIDALINSLDQLIVKKQNIKLAAMQQLLTGKQRLPGFSEDWELQRIGDIFEFLSTANNPRSDLSDHGEIGYIHYGDIHGSSSSFFNCFKKSIPYIDQIKVKNLPYLEAGDLVIADASEDYEGIGKSIEILQLNNKKIVAGLHTFLLRGNKSVIADGFKGYLQYMPSFRRDIVRLATGISVYGISKNNLREIQVKLPSIHEQVAIAKVLYDMDTEISALEQQLDKARKLKQGMMQELLTGRIRLT